MGRSTSILEVCKIYEAEINEEEKLRLGKLIVDFCRTHQDEQIPETARILYISYLCRGGV